MPLSPLDGNAEQLERTLLRVKLDGCWYRALIYADDVVLVADSESELQPMLRMVEAYV